MKHFKEYFPEFLMIFLAVTMGFFAESYREHLSDKTKEKEYMTITSQNKDTKVAFEMKIEYSNYTIM
jgi:hypothetical protein